MKKPLELKVHTYWVDELSGTAYSDREGIDFPICVEYWSLCKRLKEEELAAEYWAAGNEYRADESLRSIIKRFAILPHYDEVSK